MVDFKGKNKIQIQDVGFLKKTNLDNEYFFRIYKDLLSNPDAMKETMKLDIETNKKKGYDVLKNSDLQKISIIPGVKDGMKSLIEMVQQNVALFFISECYEPFRIFDTEEEQEKFSKKQNQLKISDYEILSYLKSHGFVTCRHFLDDFGHIQKSDERGRIASRDKNGKVSITKDKVTKVTHVVKEDIAIHMFSVKSLTYALEKISAEKSQKPAEKSEKIEL